MLIDIKDLYKIYNEGQESEVRALDGVSLQINRGEFVAIVGASGSGKSTMMNVLGCLDVPTRGEYILNGTQVTSLKDRELARIRNREIGFIFQGYNLLQDLDALDNVILPLIYRGTSIFEREELAMDIENSGILIAGLIPWSIACSIPLAMLGADASALPYALLLWLIPLCYLFTKKRYYSAE